MSTAVTFLKIQQEVEPHPLQIEGHRFSDDDIPVVTGWGDILPPKDFSYARMNDVITIALGEHAIGINESAIAVARAAVRRSLTFNESTGCWQLPLKVEYDEKNRARYPSLSVPTIGIKNRLAHRLTLEHFRGVEILKHGGGMMVDHRCMNHACCNPYHLELITAGENTKRGRLARQRAIAPDIFHLAVTDNLSYGDLKTLVREEEQFVTEELGQAYGELVHAPDQIASDQPQIPLPAQLPLWRYEDSPE